MNKRQLERLIPVETLALGAEYFAQGRVLSFARAHSDDVVYGRVRGNGRRVYQVVANMKPDAGGRPALHGHCNCRVGRNCKHVAALVLAVISADDAAGGEATDGSAEDTPARATQRLPDAARAWLAEIDRAEERAAADDPTRILYLLRRRTFAAAPPRFELSACRARQLAAGGFGQTYPFDLLSRSEARWIQRIDRQIMGFARADPHAGIDRPTPITSDNAPALLPLLCESGRAFFIDPNGPVLRLGEPRTTRLRWALADDAQLHLRAEGLDERVLLLPLAPPWYLDPANGDCGPLETGLPTRVACHLVGAPTVPAQAAAELQRALEQRFPKDQVPLPPVLNSRTVAAERPTPVLTLVSEAASEPEPPGFNAWTSFDPASPQDFALLQHDYGGVLVDLSDERDVIERVADGELLEVARHWGAEESALEELVALGFDERLDLVGDEGLPLEMVDEDGWVGFVVYEVPRLRDQGWRIEIDDAFAYQTRHADDWQLDIEEQDQGRWLDLGVGIEIDGESVDLLPLILRALQDPAMDLSPQDLDEAGDDALLPLRLDDQRLVLLPVTRLRPMLATLVELYDPEARLRPDGRLRLSRLQATELSALEQADPSLDWRGGDAARELGRRLSAFDGLEPVEPPAGLGGDQGCELRPYQRDGLNWLQFLRSYGLGGILADDMGLGKTLQALGHLLLEKQSGRADQPSLVVAPTSLMFNWRREAARFAPQLRVLLLHGPKRTRRADAFAEADLVLTTYALLPRDLETLASQTWHLLILDEAQAIKNPRSKVAQAARRLDARHRLCLTGTPLENHLGELWSLFDFLLPDLLGDERRFRRLFRNPIERQGDPDRAAQLRQRLAPFLLRRTKEQVAAELPPKTEILREVPLARDQRDLYETLRVALHQQVQEEIARKGLAQSGIIILDALLKLRQCCCDPRLVPLPSAEPVKGSAKLDLLLELLPELLQEGRRILLFSQFTSMLKLVEQALAERLQQREGRDFVKLTGRTRDRETPVDRFQSGEVPLFLISLKAGGSGLNLTAADTVIHFDPWWNPAVERQATDRAHRIGQDKPVFVYKLLTEGTVEQRVAELQARKQALADSMLEGGNSAARSFSAEDLALLFAPLD